MALLFLLPLILIFYFWHTRSITANRPYQSLVSAHLRVVACIPVLFKLAELVYDILPKKFLAGRLDLLESLNLMAIWYYFVMAGAIFAALALIYLMQKTHRTLNLYCTCHASVTVHNNHSPIFHFSEAQT